MPSAKLNVDAALRKCQCGCCEHVHSFRMTDYPPGYFSYKYQVRRGSALNICPACELRILQRMCENKDGRQSERTVQEFLEDVRLLETGRVETERHRKQAMHVYGT